MRSYFVRESRVRGRGWGRYLSFSMVFLVSVAFSVPTVFAESPPMRTVKVTPAKAKEGRALFQQCLGCHGEGAKGTIGMGPRLNSESFLAAASDEFLRRTINQGRPMTTMIPWGAVLKPAQVDAIIAYLRTLNSVGPATLDESPLKGNAVEGAKLFDTICYGCHGRNGGGYQETANGTGIGRKGFLDGVTNGFLRHIIKHGKSETAMRGFYGPKTTVANLTAADIENIIAHLRSKAW